MTVTADSTTIQRALEHVRHDLTGPTGRADVSDVRMINRHTTAANHVLRVRADVDGTSRDLFVKIDRGGSFASVRDEYDRTCTLSGYLADHERFDCAEALGCHDEPPMLVLNGASGEPLLASMRRSCERWGLEPVEHAARRARAVGQWIAALEKRSLGLAPPSAVAWSMFSEANVAAVHIHQRGYDDAFGEAVGPCMRIISQLADHPPDVPVCLAHGDAHPANFLIGHGEAMRVTAIDAALGRPQFAGYDAQYFAYQLQTGFGRWRYRPAAIAEVRRAFAEGYGAPTGRDERLTRAQGALNVLRSLRYLTSLGRHSAARRIWSRWDGRRLARTFARPAA